MGKDLGSSNATIEPKSDFWAQNSAPKLSFVMGRIWRGKHWDLGGEFWDFGGFGKEKRLQVEAGGEKGGENWD